MAIISILTKFKNWLLSEEPSELTTYIKSVLDSIEKAQTDTFVARPPIDFEISVVSTKDKGGKFHIFIADVNVKYEKEYISKIKFTFGYKGGGAIVRRS